MRTGRRGQRIDNFSRRRNVAQSQLRRSLFAPQGFAVGLYHQGPIFVHLEGLVEGVASLTHVTEVGTQGDDLIGCSHDIQLSLCLAFQSHPFRLVGSILGGPKQAEQFPVRFDGENDPVGRCALVKRNKGHAFVSRLQKNKAFAVCVGFQPLDGWVVSRRSGQAKLAILLQA